MGSVSNVGAASLDLKRRSTTIESMSFPHDNSSTSGPVPWSEPWFELQKKLLGETACRQLGLYVIPSNLTLSIVIPFFNEATTLERLTEKVAKLPIRKEIILIDDGSTDGSSELAKSLTKRFVDDKLNQVKLLRHQTNVGKGAALKTGFAQVTGDIVIIQDADLEYDPDEFPRLIQPIIEDKADVVFGSRFLGDRPHRVLYYWHTIGNRVLTSLSNVFTNLGLTDIETCYKVFRREVIEEIGPKLQSPRFGVEPEITARVARRKYRVFEVSISYNGRTFAEGKKIRWRDGFKAVWCIIRYAIRD